MKTTSRFVICTVLSAASVYGPHNLSVVEVKQGALQGAKEEGLMVFRGGHLLNQQEAILDGQLPNQPKNRKFFQ